tara:strand:- start:106 stop:465 length:360 start_codon:yes stop_codon:yes gene_type:complete
MELDLEEFKYRYQLTPEQLKDTKMSLEEIEVSQKFLLEIEDGLMEDIADWSLDERMFILEKEEDYICRFFQFSKGTTNHFVIINPMPEIECISAGMDGKLMMDISNTVMGIMVRHLHTP